MRENMEKKENNFQKIEYDETDRAIMQALSDELSEITVSEELIAATLRAAKKKEAKRGSVEETKDAGKQGAEEPARWETKQKNPQKAKRARAGRNARMYRFWGGAITAAAALFLVIFAIGGFRKNWKNMQNNYNGLTSGSAAATPPPGQSSVLYDSAESNYLTMDGFGGAEDGSANEGFGGVDWNGRAPEEFSEGMFQTDGEDVEEWLYWELLGKFDQMEPADGLAAEEEPPEIDMAEPEEILGSAGSMQETAGGEKTELSDEAGLRSIVWQRDGQVLTCVIYAPDYQMEVSLQKDGVTRRIVLTDWAYAEELWEMAKDY